MGFICHPLKVVNTKHKNKSVLRFRTVGRFYSNFNSKMVRLKAARNLERERVGLRFNSKMVRLKALRDRDYKTASEMFQFQNGTIKR